MNLSPETALALNGYFEARGEYRRLGETAYIAVMAVALNRAAHPGAFANTPQGVVAQQTHEDNWVLPDGSEVPDCWPVNVERVIAQYAQFSWTLSYDAQYRMALKFAQQPERAWDKSWLAAKDAARRVMEMAVLNPVQNATYYFNPHVCRPSWAKHCKLVRDLGNHRFMTDPACDPALLWPCPREKGWE